MELPCYQTGGDAVPEMGANFTKLNIRDISNQHFNKKKHMV
jgi:hypothetical protein